MGSMELVNQYYCDMLHSTQMDAGTDLSQGAYVCRCHKSLFAEAVIME